MNWKYISICVAILAVLLPMNAEAVQQEEGKRPFLMVQICLKNESNLSKFYDVLRSFAVSEHMTFADSGAETERELNILAKKIPDVPVNHPEINVSIFRDDDGISLGATNSGLHTYEVVIGFSEGSNPKAAQDFANRAVANLKKQWHVDLVPNNRGAEPMNSCR